MYFSGFLLYSLSLCLSVQDIKYLVTVGEGKYFSTGVDLEVVRSSHSQSFLNVLSDLQKLLSRLLVFPIITIAAINGMQVICFTY